MSTPYYIAGIALLCASCGGSDEKKVSLEQTRAAIEVRDAWRDELRPFEIVASGSIAGTDRIGVRLTSDGSTSYVPFSGNGTYRSETPSLVADTSATACASWPLSTSDTLSLTAPFSEHVFGQETARAVGERLSLQMNFKSSMALLRFSFESDNLSDILESLTLKGEGIVTRAKYLPYNGKWTEKSGEGMPVVVNVDCLLNNGRNHDFYLLPFDAASDIVLSVVVNGEEHVLKTKIPPLAAGSMTQLNLKVEDYGILIPKSSWVDNERKTDLRNIASVDSVAMGHYLRKDGLIVAKRDTLTVAVVYQTDGKHGKAVAIDDTPGAFSFGTKSLTSGKVFATIDGQRAEGIINDSSISEDERLIYKPEMPYSADTAFGYKDGASLTSGLMRSKSGKEEGSAFAVIEKHRGAYIPTLAEMADIYYRLQPYAHTKLGDLIEPFSGEYLTCSESSSQTIYGIDMTKGVVMSHYSKQHSHLKLRLIYLF